MLDSWIRRWTDRVFNAGGRALARLGFTADLLTVVGLLLGLAIVPCVIWGPSPESSWIPFLLFVANRLCDGLDGAVARARQRLTLYGGLLDFVFDMVIYAAVPFAFIVRDPVSCAVPGAVLLWGIVACGSAFLAFSVGAAKTGLETQARGAKTIYAVGGLAEGSETIGALSAMLLWPQHFATVAVLFAALCWVTAAARVLLIVHTFRTAPSDSRTHTAARSSSNSSSGSGSGGTGTSWRNTST